MLMEVNSHSLFSKYFSESGKLVAQLFQKIHLFLLRPKVLLFVLIDEVESLTSARKVVHLYKYRLAKMNELAE